MVSSAGSMYLARGAGVGPLYDLGSEGLVVEPGVGIAYAKTAVPPRGIPARLEMVSNVEPYTEEFRWKVDFSSIHDTACGNARADPSLLDVKPSSCVRLIVDAGSRVRIHSGQYTLDSLEILEGGTLEIDNSHGAVYIWVRRSLVLSGSFAPFLDESNIMIGYAGTAPPTITTAVSAMLVAPYATLELPKTPARHVGSFFAQSIVVADGAMVDHLPFVGAADTVRPAAFVCPSCKARAARVWDECCAAVDWRASLARADTSWCLATCNRGRGDDMPCESRCAAASSSEVSEAANQFEDCTSRVTIEEEHCEQGNGYRAGSCVKIGYPSAIGVGCGGP
jgi:hypothetical protein